MTPGVISFSCSSCGVRLTVPESMAGISGPCPSCSATIQAPQANTAPPATEAAVEPAPTPAPAPEPKPEPAPEPSIPDPRPVGSAPGSIPPEPRAKPEREGAKGIEPRHSTRDESMRRRQTVGSSGRRPSESKSPRLSRILLPLFFIIAGGTLVYGLCYYFLPGGPGESYRNNIGPPPELPPELQPHSNGSSFIPPMPKPRPPQSTNELPIEDPPPINADGADAIKAEEVLNRFLKTSTLAERLPMIDPPMTPEQLEGTILNKAFPEAISVSPETPAFDSVEQLTSYPFRVSFQGGEGSVVDYTIVVRKRADLDPQVAINPFLDLVGGRLAEFAATPVDGARTFYTVIEAMPRCFEEKIPNPSKKFTYKLSACDVGRATARAYASLNSALAEQLWTPDSRIRWGKRIRATITLQWNTTEDPSQPYIELLEIKGLDWNS